MNPAREWQFDGLVGPTHNYAGLAIGNLAAAVNAGSVSNPRAAALQGLEKMKFVRDLGVPQAFFPPHFRPLIPVLKRFGFAGTTSLLLERAADMAPGILASVFSSSFMWAANAATVSPSRDTADGRLHFTPANMTSHLHRSLEAPFTERLLGQIFHNKDQFCVNNYLLPTAVLGDEGAANHMMVQFKTLQQPLHLFVYGDCSDKSQSSQRFLPRQSLLASQTVARIHGLAQENCMFLQQAPGAIDQGVFHNDVIAMNTGNRMIVHAQAYIPQHQHLLQEIGNRTPDFRLVVVTPEQLPVADAVSTYFFNSQLLELADGTFVLIAPTETGDHPAAKSLTHSLIAMGILDAVHYLDVRESMRNGGGPACLRLRVPMNAAQEAAMHPEVILTDATYTALKQWITRYYRDRLCFDDLRDAAFVTELEEAYAALEGIVGMKGLYHA